MSYEIARLILEQASTFLEREEAIRTAMRLGMPLDEIESYLDWIDLMNGGKGKNPPKEGDEADDRD